MRLELFYGSKASILRIWQEEMARLKMRLVTCRKSFSSMGLKMRFSSVLLLLAGAVAHAGPASPPSGWHSKVLRGGVSLRVWGRLAPGALRGGAGGDDGKEGLLSVLQMAGRTLDAAGVSQQLMGEKNILLRAVWMEDSGVVAKLLGCEEGRALVHNIVEGGNLDGHTALHLAAIKGFSSAAKLLVEHGGAALVEATHPLAGYNALHTAALLGKADIVRLLGEEGGKKLLVTKQVKSAMADEEWGGAKVCCPLPPDIPPRRGTSVECT